MAQAIECYFQALDGQPFPLLSYLRTNSLPTPSEFPPQLLDGLLCLTLPILVDRGVMPRDVGRRAAASCEEAAWSALCRQYQAMDFSDLYFQTSCLLAQSDLMSEFLRLHLAKKH